MEANGMIFTSGQLPIDPATGKMPETAADQAEISLMNVKRVLEAGGSDMSKILKTTVFLKNIEDFDAVNKVYATFFDNSFPARSCVEVARLPKNALVEIEVIAIK
jgi:2-iminobutanoate/2-iminopropanoate deaminase